MPGLDGETAWEKLATEGVLLPASIDSVIIQGTADAVFPGRFNRMADDTLRFSFEARDAKNGKRIRGLGGEIRFPNNRTELLNFRVRIRTLTGREVVIVPTVSGIASGGSDITYNLIHVHTLLDDSLEQAPLAKGGSELEAELPKVHRLYQNYPNPFNPETTIKFELPEDAIVSLKVYDILGKEVATLIDGFEEAGYHQASLNATNLASGLYFYRITAGSFTDVKKLVVVK